MSEICLKVDCFNLKYTVECGQCFRWHKVEDVDNTYIGVIKDRVLKIRQDKENLYITSNNNDDLESVVRKYFDLDVDYTKLEQEISNYDRYVKKAVGNSTGIRILNQDFFETLISYIISANNNIPRISKSVNEISKRYGEKVIFEGNEYYLFPTPQRLKGVSIEEYRDCGVGYRDSYILDTVNRICKNQFNIDSINNMSTDEVRSNLLELKGVGPKVADCILLFSCNRGEVFPIDVWVERTMSALYFKEAEGPVKKKVVLEYASNKFGRNAGIVQQHLFYNMREKMLI